MVTTGLAFLNFVLFVVLAVAVGLNKVSATKLLKVVVAFVVLAIAMIVEVYSIGCLFTGTCAVWSWLLTIFIAAVLIASITYIIVTLAQGKKLKAILIKQENYLEELFKQKKKK